jgi:DNA-binding MarR family transcriptional regulator
MTMGTLQRHLQLSSATLTGAIDRLQKEGLVKRRPADDDKRAFVLEPCMTPRQWTSIQNGIEHGDALCFSVLSASERKELLRLLEKCSAYLEETAAAK